MSATETSFKPKNSKSKAIFNSSLLEKLSRTHISVPLTIFYVSSAAFVAYGITQTSLSTAVVAGLFVAGFVFFTLFEYVMHRFLFHMAPTNKVKKTIQYSFHGVHHEFPKDKTRLAMPPLLSTALMLTLLGGFYVAIGDYTFGFLPGFLTGYASYLCVHYVVHAFRPPKNIFKVLWVHHGIHHYKDHTVAYGVSSPFWDWVFRTMPKKQA
ncbi:MAG: sterol desaturase family protein [Bernardetiaceae bacterium]|nr:sterol desaturase family protein [Bernardetiaceae bacterium]